MTTQQAPEYLPFSSADLLSRLDSMQISYDLHHHAPIFTVQEGAHLKARIPGMHCRNLFVKDKKGAMFLITAANETAIDLKKLAGVLDCGRLSFGSPERLWSILGIRPGSVNPFCIVNDADGAVRIFLDDEMMKADIINVHPMDNAMTIGLSPHDLVRVIENTGHVAEILDSSAVAPD